MWETPLGDSDQGTIYGHLGHRHHEPYDRKMWWASSCGWDDGSGSFTLGWSALGLQKRQGIRAQSLSSALPQWNIAFPLRLSLSRRGRTWRGRTSRRWRFKLRHDIERMEQLDMEQLSNTLYRSKERMSCFNHKTLWRTSWKANGYTGKTTRSKYNNDRERKAKGLFAAGWGISVILEKPNTTLDWVLMRNHAVWATRQTPWCTTLLYIDYKGQR